MSSPIGFPVQNYLPVIVSTSQVVANLREAISSSVTQARQAEVRLQQECYT
jgi:hypothetical protein